MNSNEKLSCPLLEWSLLNFSLHWVYTGQPSKVGPASDSESMLRSWLLHQGSVSIRMKDAKFSQEIEAGNWIFLPVDSHERVFSYDARLSSIWFRAHWPDGSDLFTLKKIHTVPAEAEPKLTRCARRMERAVQRLTGMEGRRMHHEQANLSQYMKLEQLTAEWIEQYSQCLARQGITPNLLSSDNLAMDKVRAQIENWPLNQSLNRNTLAEAVNMSVSYMETSYVAAFGQTPRQTWNNHRKRYAHDFIIRTPKPIKLLAHELGFTDLAQFSNWFRHQYGESPRNYRNHRKPQAPALTEGTEQT